MSRNSQVNHSQCDRSSDDTGIEECFEGKRLYGDDFGDEQVDAWFNDERDAYADLLARSGKRCRYEFHALNCLLGYHFLPASKVFENALGFGSAHADEFLPIRDRLRHVTIIEPAKAFRSSTLGDTPLDRIAPSPSGRIPFPDGHFDLVTSLSVLHHIANVSYVFGELVRCTKSGGFILVREPVTSMSDWRRPRPGLTLRERGIPVHILDGLVASSDVSIMSRRLFEFSLMSRALAVLHVPLFNSTLLTRIDGLLCSAFQWNLRYHATRIHHRIRPQALFYVLQKDGI